MSTDHRGSVTDGNQAPGPGAGGAASRTRPDAAPEALVETPINAPASAPPAHPGEEPFVDIGGRLDEPPAPKPAPRMASAPVAALCWDIRVALAFLTRLPLPFDHARAAETFPRSVWAYPIVGAVVGGFGGLVFWAAWLGGLPPLACALMALAVETLLAGGLHEDGLSDMADGLGGATRERSLDIMRDSRVGSYGVLALIFAVALKAAALTGMPGPETAFVLLVAAGAFSRALLPVAMSFLPLARADGLGASAGRPPRAAVAGAAALGLAGVPALLWPEMGPAALAVMAAAGAASAIIARLAMVRFGGYTGDVLGAMQQTAAIAMLLAAGISLS